MPIVFQLIEVLFFDHLPHPAVDVDYLLAQSRRHREELQIGAIGDVVASQGQDSE